MEMGKEISYPKDPKLRQAFQGLIKLVLTEGKVKFQTKTCIDAIMDHMELLDDKSTNPKQQSGSNYKRAKNYLKTLNKYAKLVTGTFAVVEIFVFTTDGKRVQTLDDLKQICSEDPEMNKVIAAFKDFDYEQPWIEPPKITDLNHTSSPILSELARIDREIETKKLTVAAAPKVERHAGTFKGSEDPGAARKAVIHVTKKRRDRGKVPEQEKKLERERGQSTRETHIDDINHRNPQSEFA